MGLSFEKVVLYLKTQGMPLIGTKKIKALGELRKSEVIVYFTGDKQPVFGAQIADDIIPLLNEQLEVLSGKTKPKKLSLFMYSTGGVLTTPWPFVNLIREYCEEFEVIVPYKAMSAATLISLGADKIVMTPLSKLSPIDPTGHFQGVSGDKPIDVEVENIISFFDFAQNKVGIKSEAGLVEAFKELTKTIPAQVVGSVNRTHSLIRMLAAKMLQLHKNPIPKKQKEKIIKTLTETLFSHQYYISRNEAKNDVGLGSVIEYSSGKLTEIIGDLLGFYSQRMQLQDIFNPGELLGVAEAVDFEIMKAAIHSRFLQYSLISKYKIQKVVNPRGEVNVNVGLSSNNWIRNSFCGSKSIKSR